MKIKNGTIYKPTDTPPMRERIWAYEFVVGSVRNFIDVFSGEPNYLPIYKEYPKYVSVITDIFSHTPENEDLE